MDKMDTELLVQFRALLGIVNEGEIVTGDDYEQSLEVSYDDVRRTR